MLANIGGQPIYLNMMDLEANIKKAQLATGSNNQFACKDGKSFLDKNNVGRLVRDVGAKMDYTNCGYKNKVGIEQKVVSGS